jgi:dynein heavy chain
MGRSVLFEGVQEELDPMVDPILEKNFIKQAGVTMLVMGDNPIPYSDDFRLFLTTKIGNPNYTPEIFGKTMIINFSVTMQGLRDQLLNEVVQYERPELEEARKKLIIETSANKATLKELEDTLLSELANQDPDVSLVDNVPLIETLNTAKSKSVEISKSLEVAEVTKTDINNNRENYKKVAWRASILFFAIQGLKNIEKMYEYSLGSYMTVFMNALETSRKDNILQNRLRIITDRLTMLVYEFACMGIFEAHKLTFSFQMVTMIMDGDDILNKVELDFFLKGNTSLDAIEEKNPHKWISANSWKDLVKLNSLGEVWNGIVQSIKTKGKEWEQWYDSEAPESNAAPDGYTDKLSKFQMLSLMRVIRPDRVINSIKMFIGAQIQNDYYIKSPLVSFEKVYAQSTCKTPIVFILSPGADPFSDVYALAQSTGLGV